jgi:hypothetical protein
MYLRSGNFDNERNQRWVNASLGLERIETFMIPTVQGLGLLHCKILPEDARYERLSVEEQGTIEESVMLTERFMLSSLWVMGAYELVRTLDERHKNDDIFIVGEVAEDVHTLKIGMARLRMPLAKMAPATKHKATDYPIPRPYIMPGYGVAWRVSDDKLISRRWLSDGLLGFG